ncbi:hypothetical protein ASPVEDRAFT_41579 [Aspergillus versicolor CBS 583.65]|uniref:BHLH domain-containing protein n=1 Tax=Aspergillus versicolor CBS 583.65 TaxID=1036611 RepID=A0A1L9PKT7_ASPVE|nr:uncharacterized protein ASPVEDRAFT_41579 [Aspergillus versicolor CBS 583.65]OJJ02092.1 hypothetical protein ASPVEDRAFT_41579 [Aspergillus versicolor CBS 583.65]
MNGNSVNRFYALPSVHIEKHGSTVTCQQLQGHRTGHGFHSARPPIRQNVKAIAGSIGSLKSHIRPNKQRLSPNNNSLPSVEPWRSVRQSSEGPPRKSMEPRSSRIHLSRSNDRLMACDCPYPEQGPLCVVPSVVTTVTGGDINAALQKPNSSRRVMEWASGFEKQAMNIIHNPSVLYTGPFTAYSDPITSPRDRHLERGDDIDRSTTISSLGDTATTVQCSSTIATEEVPPDTAHKMVPPKSNVSQPSKDCLISKPLPQPPERTKQSRIEALELRKRDLARRRQSTEKAIYAIMWSPQPDSVLYDMNAREETKKTTTRLNSELDSVRREEHEVGLSLVRALKLQDEKSCSGEGTSLWVNRMAR